MMLNCFNPCTIWFPLGFLKSFDALLISGRKNNESKRPDPIIATCSHIITLQDEKVSITPAIQGPIEQYQLTSRYPNTNNLPRGGPKTVPNRKNPVAVPL